LKTSDSVPLHVNSTVQTPRRGITVLIVAGTRPEAIKLAPVIVTSRAEKDVRTLFCLTGQHRELADDVIEFFGLNADYRLDVMRDNQDLSGVTSRILDGLQPILLERKPDVVLVQGDTLTCFAASLAAFLEKIPVCHVEAGLRTHDLTAPFPEEALRQMVTRIAAVHFAATSANRDNLLAEGVPAKNIIVTGNTVIDALFWARKRLLNSSEALQSILPENVLAKVESYSRVILITNHRRENFGEKLANICHALAASALRHPDVLFVYPVHPNPNVLRPVRTILANLANVLLLPPLNYPAFVFLMNRCYLVVTDSGGIQEEAPALGKPVLVTREETERKEAVETGQVSLIGTGTESILEAIEEMLCCPERYARMVQNASPYGDGNASGRIVASTIDFVRRRQAASRNER
jgi:UDP-N-acetylglucosamine 2-epimerase (non-hydrolysing)